MGVVSAVIFGFQVERATHDDMVDTRALEHIGYQFRSDRSPGLVLLVLARIWEVGKLQTSRPDCFSRRITGREADSRSRLTTAVMRLALAILQACAMISVSMSEALVERRGEEAVLRVV
jgi:hypothetical protein